MFVSFQDHRRPLADDLEVETVLLDESGNASHVSAAGRQRYASNGIVMEFLDTRISRDRVTENRIAEY